MPLPLPLPFVLLGVIVLFEVEGIAAMEFVLLLPPPPVSDTELELVGRSLFIGGLWTKRVLRGRIDVLGARSLESQEMRSGRGQVLTQEMPRGKSSFAVPGVCSTVGPGDAVRREGQ